MAQPRIAKIELGFGTKGAEKDLKDVKSKFKKTAEEMQEIEERAQFWKSTRHGAYSAAVTGAFSYALQSPTQSKASAAVESSASTTEVVSTVVGGVFGGAGGAIIGQTLGKALGDFQRALAEEIRAVKDKSLNDIQGIATQFAEVGVLLSNDAIKTLLEEREKINKRVWDAVKRVKNVQDQQYNVLNVIQNSASRRMSDAFSYVGF